MIYRCKMFLAFWCIGSMSIAFELQAHDLHGIVAERNALDSETKAKFDEIEQLRGLLATRAAANPNEGQLEAVVQQALRWPTNRATVCFFDGSQVSRDRVATVAKQWQKETALQLDFGESGNSRTCDPQHPDDIRVSFVGSGYWSYVGTQAKDISAYKQTLNLEGLDRELTPADKGVILHEFGHAIGFEHEHQSPVSGCEEEFNWNYLYVAMGWSKEEVDRNMRRLVAKSGKTGLLTTPFDAKSIMLYSLSPAAFKNPSIAKCFIGEPNNNLSLTDRAAAQVVYPPTNLPAASPSAYPAGTQTPSAASRATLGDRGANNAAQLVHRLNELIATRAKQ
jgi:Astacin (Peptidase family M12A)